VGPGEFVSQDTLVANLISGSTQILTGSRVAGQTEPTIVIRLLSRPLLMQAYQGTGLPGTKVSVRSAETDI